MTRGHRRAHAVLWILITPGLILAFMLVLRGANASGGSSASESARGSVGPGDDGEGGS